MNLHKLDIKQPLLPYPHKNKKEQPHAPAHGSTHSDGKWLSGNDLKGMCKENGTRLFSAAQWQNRRKWAQIKTQTSFKYQETHFHCKGDWGLPREMVESSFLEICKSPALPALGDSTWVGEGGPDSLKEVPSNLSHFAILYWFPHCLPLSFTEPLELFLIVVSSSSSPAAQGTWA